MSAVYGPTFLMNCYICQTVLNWQKLGKTVSDAGGGLRLLRVTGSCGSGLSGQRVHGTQELICDAPGLPEPAEQGAMNCSGVIPDGVLTSEEQAGDRLKGEEENPHWDRSWIVSTL